MNVCISLTASASTTTRVQSSLAPQFANGKIVSQSDFGVRNDHDLKLHDTPSGGGSM